MFENNCAVYVHINLINGKKYFGITTQNPPENRWKNGNGYIRNSHFTNAVKKYGWNNFAHYILYRDIPIVIAKNIEEMLIREHMSYDPRFGYNKTMGGELEIPNDEARKKMSDAHKGKILSEEVRKKMGDARKGKKNHMYGKRYSSEERRKISEATKMAMSRPEVRAKICKPVEAINPKTGCRVHYFESTNSADKFGFNHRHISECCNGKLKTHKGYIWRYVEGGDNDDSDN